MEVRRIDEGRNNGTSSAVSGCGAKRSMEAVFATSDPISGI